MPRKNEKWQAILAELKSKRDRSSLKLVISFMEEQINIMHVRDETEESHDVHLRNQGEIKRLRKLIKVFKEL